MAKMDSLCIKEKSWKKKQDKKYWKWYPKCILHSKTGEKGKQIHWG